MIKSSVIVFLVTLVLPVMAFAATDDFIVTQQIGADSNPPTIPVGLVATPVVTTQINLAWGTSTDAESSVAGYQVFRNDLQIATTSATSYSDTGLTASTSYDYNITAFDLFFNISARSATSSTTTLPTPATTTPTTTPSGGGGGSGGELKPVTLVISEVQVETSDTSAAVSFKTPVYAIASVRYGLTPSFELSSLASDVYRKEHTFNLLALESGRKYYFEIIVQNQRGDVVTYKSTFVTKSIDDTVPPENISRFRATISGDDVILDWKNPAAKDFDRVRIIANSNFYPSDIADGLIVYDGKNESFRHTGVHPLNDGMYYTAFAIDAAGNQSSGAIADVQWMAKTPAPPIATSTPSTTPTTTPTTTLEVLDFNDLEFVQNSKIRSGYHSLIDLDPNKPFTIRLPYDAVPEHLKTITITLSNPNDASLTFAFLLRINKAKTHYEATIGALKHYGQYPLHFSFFDFKTKEIANFNGTISTVPKTEQTYPEPKRTLVEHLLFIASRYWWCWLLVLLLLYMAYRLMTEERVKN